MLFFLGLFELSTDPHIKHSQILHCRRSYWVSRKRKSRYIPKFPLPTAIIRSNTNALDTQSWFHSQEINIMVDSAEMCAEWRSGLESNQNTKLYGLISDKDGFWRDSEGNIVDSKAGKGGVKGLLKGVQGAVARVRGTGGF